MSTPEKKPEKTPKKAAKSKVSIELPKDLQAAYGNVAFIHNSPAEIVIDFAQVLPRMPKGKVVSRVIMSPMHAKMFLKALTHNVENFERQFGEIKMPKRPTLADQLFNFPQDEKPPEDKE